MVKHAGLVEGLKLNQGEKIRDVAQVGIRDGQTLLVTTYESENSNLVMNRIREAGFLAQQQGKAIIVNVPK